MHTMNLNLDLILKSDQKYKLVPATIIQMSKSSSPYSQTYT